MPEKKYQDRVLAQLRREQREREASGGLSPGGASPQRKTRKKRKPSKRQLQRAQEGMQTAEQWAQEEVDDRPGLLTRISDAFEAVDAPFRGTVAHIITGKPYRSDMTEAQFNEEVLGIEPTAEGSFPFKEMLTGMVVSPFNFLGPVGGLTSKGGKIAKAADLRAALKARVRAGRSTKRALKEEIKRGTPGAAKRLEVFDRPTREILKQIKKLEAMSPDLAKSLGDQLRRGERSLLQLRIPGIPFTRNFRGKDRPLDIWGGKSAPGVGALGDALSAAGRQAAKLPGARPLGRQLDRAFRRTPQARQARALLEAQKGVARSIEEAGTVLGHDTAEAMEGVARQLGASSSSPEFRERLFNAWERSAEHVEEAVRTGQDAADSDKIRKAILESGTSASDEHVDFLRDLTTITAIPTLQQIKRGARPSESLLADERIGYVKRMWTPEAKALARKNKKLKKKTDQVLRDELERLNTFETSQIGRNAGLRGKLTTELNKTFRAAGFKGDVFELDVPKVLREAWVTKNLSTLNANVGHSYIRSFGMRGEGVDLADFITRAGIFRLPASTVRSFNPKYAGGDLVFSPKSPNISRDTVQSLLRKAKIQDIRLPEDTTRVMFEQTLPAVSEGIGRLFDWVNSNYARLLTLPFPAFHVRNAMGNTVQMGMAGMSPPEIVAGLGAAFARSFKKGPAADAHRRYMRQAGVHVGRAGFAGALSEEFLRNELRGVKSVKDLMKKPTPGNLMEISGRVGQETENLGREALFMHAKKYQGLDDVAALRLVNKHLFDYSSLTDFERKFPNRMMLFYRWTSNVLPWLASSAAENPKVFRLMAKAAAPTTEAPGLERSSGTPSFIRRYGGIPFTRTESGREQAISGLPLPIQDLARFDFRTEQESSGVGGAALRVAHTAATHFLSPPIVGILEAVAGRDFFYNRPIEQLRGKAPPSLRRAPGWLQKAFAFEEIDPRSGTGSQYRMDPYVEWLLRKSPLSRGLGVLKKLDDPRRRELLPGISKELLLQTLVGFNIQSWDHVTGVVYNAKRRLRRELNAGRRKGLVGTFTSPYLTRRGKDPNNLDATEVRALIELNRAFSEVLRLRRDAQAQPTGQ